MIDRTEGLPARSAFCARHRCWRLAGPAHSPLHVLPACRAAAATAAAATAAAATTTSPTTRPSALATSHFCLQVPCPGSLPQPRVPAAAFVSLFSAIQPSPCTSHTSFCPFHFASPRLLQGVVVAGDWGAARVRCVLCFPPYIRSGRPSCTHFSGFLKLAFFQAASHCTAHCSTVSWKLRRCTALH